MNNRYRSNPNRSVKPNVSCCMKQSKASKATEELSMNANCSLQKAFFPEREEEALSDGKASIDASKTTVVAIDRSLPSVLEEIDRTHGSLQVTKDK